MKIVTRPGITVTRARAVTRGWVALPTISRRTGLVRVAARTSALDVSNDGTSRTVCAYIMMQNITIKKKNICHAMIQGVRPDTSTVSDQTRYRARAFSLRRLFIRLSSLFIEFASDLAVCKKSIHWSASSPAAVLLSVVARADNVFPACEW